MFDEWFYDISIQFFKLPLFHSCWLGVRGSGECGNENNETFAQLNVIWKKKLRSATKITTESDNSEQKYFFQIE